MNNLDDLVKILGCQNKAYRRDECGDWRVEGKSGWIYEGKEGFNIYCFCATARAWSFAKKDLAFCRLRQDGEDDGYFVLDRLPTEAEAEIIRDKLKIRKKKSMSEEHLAILRAAGSKGRFHAA